jgi:hypothetical protein
MLKKELQYKCYPWAWAAFMVFICFYVAGYLKLDPPENFYNSNITNFTAFSKIAPYSFKFFIVLLASVYIMMFSEPLTPSRARKIYYAFQNKDYNIFWSEIPLWAVSFAIMLISTIFFALESNGYNHSYKAVLFSISCITFAVRDGAILHYFTIGKQDRKSISTAAMYLFVFYVVLPLLLVGLDQATSLFNEWPTYLYPLVYRDSATELIPLIPQAAIALYLLHKKAKKLSY